MHPNLFAYDSVISCHSKSIDPVFGYLQSSYDRIQVPAFTTWVLTEFEKRKKVPVSLSKMTPKQGRPIDFVNYFKYQGIHMDDSLTFNGDTESLMKKSKVKLCFFYL